MQADANIPPLKNSPQVGAGPPPLPEHEAPAIGAPASSASASPPLLPGKPTRKFLVGQREIAILLSVCLGLFLADALMSLLDDSLILFFSIHLLTAMRGTVAFLALLMTIVVYCLMGFTPMIPKRLFLPVTLFNPATVLAGIPFLIYFYSRFPQFQWIISLCQVVLGLSILYWVQGGFRFRWPLVPQGRLPLRHFSWRNLAVFLFTNVFLLLPAVIACLLLFAALAVNHFSDGFLALRSTGFVVQVRKYVRSDGKMIQLCPMSHIGEPDFYRKLSESFPTNSIILMEGVTDNRNLLTNKISYELTATSLGLSEQKKEFQPARGELVRADVDIEQFSASTIDLLNLAMLFHTKGAKPEEVLKMIQYSPPPHFEERLVDDLLRKRNRRLLEELHARLSQSEIFIIPWGVAHMPEIAEEIQKSGFRLSETQEYMAIRFRSGGKRGKSAGQ